MVLITTQRAKAAPRDGRRSDDKSKQRGESFVEYLEKLVIYVWAELGAHTAPQDLLPAVCASGNLLR